MKVQRVQLSRKRGWRMPPRTFKVDRSTRWGNPFTIGEISTHPATGRRILVRDAEQAVQLFELYLRTSGAATLVRAAKIDLQGKNLACWCKIGSACHGDVLLRVANESHATAA